MRKHAGVVVSAVHLEKLDACPEQQADYQQTENEDQKGQATVTDGVGIILIVQLIEKLAHGQPPGQWLKRKCCDPADAFDGHLTDYAECIFSCYPI